MPISGPGRHANAKTPTMSGCHPRLPIFGSRNPAARSRPPSYGALNWRGQRRAAWWGSRRASYQKSRSRPLRLIHGCQAVVDLWCSAVRRNCRTGTARRSPRMRATRIANVDALARRLSYPPARLIAGPAASNNVMRAHVPSSPALGWPAGKGAAELVGDALGDALGISGSLDDKRNCSRLPFNLRMCRSRPRATKRCSA